MLYNRIFPTFEVLILYQVNSSNSLYVSMLILLWHQSSLLHNNVVSKNLLQDHMFYEFFFLHMALYTYGCNQA